MQNFEPKWSHSDAQRLPSITRQWSTGLTLRPEFRLVFLLVVPGGCDSDSILTPCLKTNIVKKKYCEINSESV